MAIYEKKWWQKFFGKKEHSIKTDQLKEIEAVTEFLSEINDDSKYLLTQLNKLEELEKERQVGRESIRQINLETQAEVFDKLLERYEYFQNDVDINGLRVKRMAGEFIKEAEKAGLKDLVKEKKKSSRWQLLW